MNLENLNPIAIRVDTTGGVLVRDESLDFQAWIDVEVDDEGELWVDWNKYIFYHHNAEDMREQEMQKNPYIFMAFSDTASSKLETLGYIEYDSETDKFKQLKEFKVWDIKEN